MKYITVVLLLAFAFPSWAEDEVWYCVEEHNYGLDNPPDGNYKLVHYKDEKFTFKYEADENRLAIVGRTWAGDEPFYLECGLCSRATGFYSGVSETTIFKLHRGRFFHTTNAYTYAAMRTGTCTKF